MFTPADVRRAFPEASFSSPASEATIAGAERQLGQPLPQFLRELYLEFDGFLGPTGSPFLFPVLTPPREGAETLTTYTQFFRTETGMPDWLKNAVVVGDDGTGMAWFVLLDENLKIVRWDAEWEEYEAVEDGLLEEWIRAKEHYDRLLREV